MSGPVAPPPRPCWASLLADFAEEVGPADPVCVVGGGTQWAVGGLPDPGTREVAAPSGVVSHEPAEMIVRVGAGTPVAELAATMATAGQMVPLDPAVPELATVGGVLAVGHSGPRRLRYGPIRDTVLEVRFVNASGQMVRAGGPVVKNVTGYDLCRLLVGSLGTLGLLAQVVLRAYPVPACARWFHGVGGDPLRLRHRLYQPSAILWNGVETWVLLEGHPDDVTSQARQILGSDFAEISDAIEVPQVARRARLSVPVSEFHRLSRVPGEWLAEVGVGTVHTDQPADLSAALGQPWPRQLKPRVTALHHALQERFDPTGRLNPGRHLADAPKTAR